MDRCDADMMASMSPAPPPPMQPRSNSDQVDGVGGLITRICPPTHRSGKAFSSAPIGFFKLSAASAVMLFLEMWYFQIIVLLAGLLPNPEVSLDSVNLCESW